MVADLQQRHGVSSGPMIGWLHQGRALLWEGNPEEQARARPLLEKAVAAAPDDVEALTALAEIYIHLAADDPGLRERVSALLSRASILGGESVSWRRASAWLSVSDGDAAGVLERAGDCGRPIAQATQEGSGVDLTNTP